MRVTLASCGLLVGLLGTYLVGAGVFADRPLSADPWQLLLQPLRAADPTACFFLAISVACAFFSLAVAAGTPSGGKTVRPVHVLLWGAVFSVLTAGGFSVLTYLLWRQGAGARTVGFVFTLASVQAFVGLLLAGGATCTCRDLRPQTVPIFALATVETALLGTILACGAS